MRASWPPGQGNTLYMKKMKKINMLLEARKLKKLFYDNLI